jgi:hypothetical protein
MARNAPSRISRFAVRRAAPIPGIITMAGGGVETLAQQDFDKSLPKRLRSPFLGAEIGRRGAF